VQVKAVVEEGLVGGAERESGAGGRGRLGRRLQRGLLGTRGPAGYECLGADGECRWAKPLQVPV